VTTEFMTRVSCDTRITGFEVVPLAFSDPPLLNAAGVHEPLALRTLVRLRVGDVVAWGEGRGDALPADVVPAVRDAVLGLDVFATSRIEAAVDA
jgi:glucarate dehydratase